MEKVIVVCSFLKESEYDDPSKFVPSAKNTIVRSFNVHDKYPNFDLLIEKARLWYKEHVLTGISPSYLKGDEEILKELKTRYISPDTNIEDLINECIELTEQIKEVEVTLKPSQKRLKALQERIKEYSVQQFQPNENNVVIALNGYTFNTALSYKKEIDKKKLEEDGILDNYIISTPVYTLRVSKNKEAK